MSRRKSLTFDKNPMWLVTCMGRLILLAKEMSWIYCNSNFMLKLLIKSNFNKPGHTSINKNKAKMPVLVWLVDKKKQTTTLKKNILPHSYLFS